MRDISRQEEDNSPSIEHPRTHPMFVSWILSVVTRLRKCSKTITIILHIIHFVICSVIVAYDAKAYFTSSDIFDNIKSKNDIYEIMYYVNKVMCYVSVYYYVYHGIKQYDKWPKLMSNIKNLDQEIRKETPMSNWPIKIVEVLVILATFGPLFLIIHVVYYNFNPQNNPQENSQNIASDLLLYYMIGQSFINNFIFDVIVYVLYHRFQTINKLIKQLNQEFNDPLITSKIRNIQKLHKEICDVVIMVNDIHGFHLLLFSTNCITMVVTTLYRIYIENDKFMLRNNILWILYTTQFGLTCWICTLARNESENTGVIISKIALNCNDVNLDNHNGTRNQPNVEVPSENQVGEQNPNRSSSNNENHDVLDRDHVKKEVNNFWIQSQQNRVAITACNFLEMNNVLFSGFVGVIINYLIILIQDNPDILDKMQEHCKNISLQDCNFTNISQNVTVKYAVTVTVECSPSEQLH
ncbi:unnamed protein product [Lasius platythorax]